MDLTDSYEVCERHARPLCISRCPRICLRGVVWEGKVSARPCCPLEESQEANLHSCCGQLGSGLCQVGLLAVRPLGTEELPCVAQHCPCELHAAALQAWRACSVRVCQGQAASESASCAAVRDWGEEQPLPLLPGTKCCLCRVCKVRQVCCKSELLPAQPCCAKHQAPSRSKSQYSRA